MPRQPQADRGQAQGGVTTSLPHTEPATYNAFARAAGVRLASLAFREDHSRRQAALPAANACTSLVVRALPPMPQSPLSTSSTVTHVTPRMFSPSIETMASVSFLMI